MTKLCPYMDEAVMMFLDLLLIFVAVTLLCKVKVLFHSRSPLMVCRSIDEITITVLYLGHANNEAVGHV